MKASVIELLSVCVFAVLAVLCEAKSSNENPPPLLTNHQLDSAYPSPINHRSEERYLPQNFAGLYPLPFNYNHEFGDLPPPSYDQQMRKHHAYQKYYKKSKKQIPESKYDYGFKKQHQWPKYEDDETTRFIPRVFDNEYNEEAAKQYHTPIFEYEPKSRDRPHSPYYEKAYGHQIPPLPLRENVNIFITPPSKRRNKKVRQQVTSSEDSYESHPRYRKRCSWRKKFPASSYERVYRSPSKRHEGSQRDTKRHEEVLEHPMVVDYDRSTERRIRLYRRELYGSSPSAAPSSEESVTYSTHKRLFPKRSPQHPEEFFASQKLTNESSSATPSSTSQQEAGSPESEDTLTFIRRVLADQRQPARATVNKNKAKPHIVNPERVHPDYSILGEGLISGYAGGSYANGFYGGKTGAKQGAMNETDTVHSSLDVKDESNASSDSSVSSYS